MNFGVDFKTIAPVPFRDLLGKGKDAQAVPVGPADDGREARRVFLSKINRRRFACLKAAEEFLPEILPAEAEALHCTMTGYFDLCHVLVVLLNRFDCPAVEMNLKTLSLSKRNVQEYCALLDQGRVRSMSILAADYFRKIEPEIFAELLTEFRARNQRVGIDRDHSKIVCIRLEDGRRYVIETSANQRTNRNKEQLTLYRDAGLFAYRNGEIEEAITRYAV